MSHDRKLRTKPFWRPPDQVVNLSGPGPGQWVAKTHPSPEKKILSVYAGDPNPCYCIIQYGCAHETYFLRCRQSCRITCSLMSLER